MRVTQDYTHDKLSSFIGKDEDRLRRRIQDFHWGGGGGGRKRLCASTHITSAKPDVPFGRGPGTACACFFYFFYLSLNHKHSDTKWGKKNIVDQILGGKGALIISILIQTGIKNT